MITQESVKKALDALGSFNMSAVPYAMKCGDVKRILDHLGIMQEPTPRPPFHQSYSGISVIEDTTIPPDEAHMLDKDGKIIQKFKIHSIPRYAIDPIEPNVTS